MGPSVRPKFQTNFPLYIKRAALSSIKREKILFEKENHHFYYFFTQFYLVLPSFTRFYLVLPSFPSLTTGLRGEMPSNLITSNRDVSLAHHFGFQGPIFMERCIFDPFLFFFHINFRNNLFLNGRTGFFHFFFSFFSPPPTKKKAIASGASDTKINRNSFFFWFKNKKKNWKN